MIAPRLRLFAVCTVFVLPVSAFDHSAWNQVLKESVNAIGEVDYSKLKANPAKLEGYVQQLAAKSPVSHPAEFAGKADQLAYYINAYNALVTHGVVKAYPTKSVRDLGALYAFFRKKDYVLGGKKLSLQDLENDIIRKQYSEPRIHFAIVCASLSCPKLSNTAYTADNLEQQLEFQTRQYFAETRNLAIDGAVVTLAAILDWYKEDFGVSKPKLLEYAKRYAPAAKVKEIESIRSPRILFRDYDWSINDPGSRARAKTAEERELAKPAS
jgi:hypothetical protein